MIDLDLVVYERNADGDYLDAPAADGRRYVISLEDVEVLGFWQRFTDAELAAEYWRALSDLGAGAHAGWTRHQVTTDAMVKTLERFASRPDHEHHESTP